MSTTTLIQIELDRMTSVQVIDLPERFDAFAEVDFETKKQRAGTTVLLDGSNVRFADLSALQSLVDARLSLLDVGSDLAIGAPSNELLATLELTGFGDLVPYISGEQR